VEVAPCSTASTTNVNAAPAKALRPLLLHWQLCGEQEAGITIQLANLGEECSRCDQCDQELTPSWCVT
jgi:hypothetical protein